MFRKLSAGLSVFALAALSSHGADARELPPLSCSTISLSHATCDWTNPDQDECTWEEDGTPTICAPLSNAKIRLRTAGTYRGGYNNANASAGVAYDAETHRLFVANKPTQTIDVVDMGHGAVNANRPRRLAKECSISVADLDPASAPGGYVPVRLVVRKDGILAVTLQQKDDATRQGKIALLDARLLVKNKGAPSADCSAAPLRVIDVGFMPTLPSFTADAKYLLVTNQGEPSDDYCNDPAGSVSIIDMSGGIATARETDNVTFEPFNALKQWLIGRGVRISGPDFSQYCNGSTAISPEASSLETTSVEQDLEPEGIAISADSRFAWITLPENNAVATLDIRRGKFVAIQPFGSKDYNLEGNGFDPIDGDDMPTIETWPIRGMYMPKQVAIAAPHFFPVLVYPNRGVRRNLDAFGDEVRLKDLPMDYFDLVKEPKPIHITRDLDPDEFPVDDPNAVALRNLRLKVSWVDGDSDGNGLLEQVFAFGGRSFAIRSLDNRLISDSGDDFERITAQAWRDTDGYFLYNTPDDENAIDENSDLRGPEPVSVATGRIGPRTYAFIGLERVGGVMTYDITNPFKPTFQHYINNRNFDLNPKDRYKDAPDSLEDPTRVCTEKVPESPQCANVGDQSAEQILFISADESPNKKPLIVVSNATSGSATIFQIDQTRH
jgi:DNA-binding beta-propeller fold protein YncE